jgi:hypothetical protein
MQYIVLVPGGGTGGVVTTTRFCSYCRQNITLYIRQVKLIMYLLPYFPARNKIERLSRLEVP